MKLSHLILLLFTAATIPALKVRAQQYDPAAFDIQHHIHTADAGMLSLVAEKYLMELNENNMATIRINWVNPGDDASVPQQYDYHFADPAQAPWKITKWEVLEGGGEITEGPNHYYASYRSPAVMPTGKHATISVTLQANDPTKPKVQLLQTIYFADNDNVFYFNCPTIGVIQEKYVVRANKSGLVAPSSTNAQQASHFGTAAQQAKLAELQTHLAATNDMAKTALANQHMDVDLMTSNARALFTKDKNGDFTAIEFKGDEADMVNGVAVTQKRNYMISVSFPGQSTGTYKIKSKNIIAASIVLPESLVSCTCAYDPTRDQSHIPPCSGGTITITKYDTHLGGYIEGYFSANLMSAADHVFFGDLSGKFKEKLAKAQ